MTLHNKNILSGLFLFFLLLTSCGEKEQDITPPSVSDDVEFSFTISTRTPTDPEFLEENAKYFQAGKSTILLSQRSGSIGLDFHEGSVNCYKYVFNPPEDPGSINWDQGFNFSSSKPMNWERIRATGIFGNGYSFGALYFPGENTYIEEVRSDQSDGEVFKDCDILGAHHFTSNESERLAFQFNHLMCKMHVDLYIPVYNEERNDGFDLDEVRATGIQFRTDFTINFGDFGQEYPPIAQTDNSVAGKVSDISMYLCSEPEDVKLSGDQLKNYDIYQLEEDEVKKYSFEMLFPQQTVSTGDILRFTLKRGDSEYNYTFRLDYASQNVGDFKFEPGKINQLDLYLPRSANEVVLFRAFMNDWKESSAEFTITEEKQQ